MTVPSLFSLLVLNYFFLRQILFDMVGFMSIFIDSA
ncbi:hypothetical protein ES703_43654 [subsurface metagenome]